MSKKKVDFDATNCPLCGHPLGEEEHQKLVTNLDSLVKEKSEEKIELATNEARVKFDAALTLKQQSIDQLKKEKDDAVENTKNEARAKFDAALTLKQQSIDQLKKEKDDAVENTKKMLEDVYIKNEEKFKKMLETQFENEKKGLEQSIDDMRTLNQKLQDSITSEAKKIADSTIEELRRNHQQQIAEKDIALDRLNKQVIELKMTSASSELKGTAGEFLLEKELRLAFPADEIISQKRGQESGDLIQFINIDAKHHVPQPIVYDNKEKAKITKNDLEKAQKYFRIHGTSYVIIVNAELPKEFENNLLGEKDGILLVHPKILVELVRQLRRMMIELFNTFRNNKNRETKSGQIFQYIISQDFIQKMKAIERNATELAALQKAEEKDHTKLWEMRKKRVQDLERDRNSLDAKIEAIVRDTKEAFENQTTPVFVKREKRKTANFRN